MHKFIYLFVSLLLLMSTSIKATIIAQDLSLLPGQGVLDFQYTHDIHFSSDLDGAQVYFPNESDIPNALIDNSVVHSTDNLGIITSENSNTFFGIVDTLNPDNPSGNVGAIWRIDISGIEQLNFFIEVAAMGDFEVSDTFSWEYQIDGKAWREIFESAIDESSDYLYELESGKQILLNDPLMLQGQKLTNNFTPFSQKINGTGKFLNIRLNANTNGGNEVLAFQQLKITGKVSEISAPNSIVLFVLSLMALLVSQKVKNLH